MLVDSHCHLDFAKEEERAGIIDRARRAGVRTLLTISTKLEEFPTVRAIAESDPDIWCSVGVHPHEAAVEPASAETLVALTQHPKVVGIGETGLDFYYEHSPRERQAEIFRAHIAAARETRLPLIVHTRDADPETIAILAEERPPAGVIHCFSSGRELAERAIELGFYVSISGIATFKNAQNLRDIARDLPLEWLLVETDAPYLAPVPMRGKTNEPAFVTYTAALVAELKGVTQEELARITTENFFRLFSKARPPMAAG
ncbi:MAG TPA: TatD family hydrolase [Stellaceae bacterium]|jgi:TatD DNase family protein|nr:TatD family hydrolase [Stellaceae bacterium]